MGSLSAARRPWRGGKPTALIPTLGFGGDGAQEGCWGKGLGWWGDGEACSKADGDGEKLSRDGEKTRVLGPPCARLPPPAAPAENPLTPSASDKELDGGAIPKDPAAIWSAFSSGQLGHTITSTVPGGRQHFNLGRFDSFREKKNQPHKTQQHS